MISGLCLCKSLLPSELVDSCRGQADAAYERLKAGGAAGAGGGAPLLPEGERFAPTASSFTIGAVVTEEDIQAIAAIVADGESGAWLEGELEDELILHPRQTWVRRQYAPKNYPPMHAP